LILPLPTEIAWMLRHRGDQVRLHHRITRRNAILALALSGTLGAIAPALAQNPGKTNEMPGGQGEKVTPANTDKQAEKGTLANPGGPGEKGTTSNPGATGVGKRGTKVGPSTNPGQSGSTASTAPEATGVGNRGTKAGPSTQPPASGQK